MSTVLQFFDALFWVVTCGVIGVFLGWSVAYFLPALLTWPLYLLVPQLHNPIFLWIAVGIQAVWLGYRGNRATSGKKKESGDAAPPGPIGAIFAVIGAIVGLALGILHSQPPAWASGWFAGLVGGGTTFLLLVFLFFSIRKRFFLAQR